MSFLLRPTSIKRVIFFIVLDIALSAVTLYLSYLLRFNFFIPSIFLKSFWKVFFILTLLKIFFLYLFKNYSFIWRFFSILDGKNIFMAHIFAYASFIIIYLSFSAFFNPFPRSVILIDFFLSLVFIGILRVSKRLFQAYGYKNINKPTLIVGVNPYTSTIIQTALKGDINYYPVGILNIGQNSDINNNAYISNIKIYDESRLEEIIKKKKIEAVIITKELSPKQLNSLINKLIKLNIKEIKQFKLLSNNKNKLEDISVEDLLARKPKDLDKQKIAKFIKDKTILITGAGGSIGSELVRQCIKFKAKKLILVDHSEFNLYNIEQEISGKIDFRCIMQSVVNKELLEKTFKRYKPQIILHAAAYKHVPMCEENIEEAILNNIIGTKNTIDLACKYKAEKFILISTDKAVRPTNVMGATKRVCELYAQNANCKSTEIVAVRFGNVLGSSGSVIPKFKKQIENGGPVTVTHPDITRYFMLIPEACQLVLQAASIGKGKEVFILDMGEPVKIVDLAKKMIELSGKDNIKIKFIGLRAGEKLYEELLINKNDKKTEYESIMITLPTYYDIKKLNRDISELMSKEDKIKKLKEIIPEFEHKPNIKTE